MWTHINTAQKRVWLSLRLCKSWLSWRWGKSSLMFFFAWKQSQHVNLWCLYNNCRGKELPESMSHNMRFPTMWYLRPLKTQISLHIRAYWSESLLGSWIVYDSKATDRTSFEVSMLKRRLHRIAWVYTCQNATLLETTCRGSNVPFKALIQLDIF